MALRIGIALGICLCVASAASAQVVRFQTSVGDFDMVLNPTNDPRLQEHVDNMLLYVENGNYKSSWINRAAEGFVLQMGGFFSHTKRPPLTIDSTRPVATFAPVQGHPAATINGLSNTAGTVALALPGDGFGGTNRDAGTSSFFVNLGTNDFLDADFTVFAAISDMTVINEIMALMQRDYTQDEMFGIGPGNLAFIDVPLMDNGFQVFIDRAFVVTDQMAIARARASVGATVANSAETFNVLNGNGALNGTEVFNASGLSSPSASAPLSALAVPEPTSALLAAAGFLGMSLIARRRRRQTRDFPPVTRWGRG